MAKPGKLAIRATKDEDERIPRIKKFQYFILIVCEDQNTEPHYFRSFIDRFPEETVFVHPVGTGTNYVGVVERAITERQRFADEYKKEIDETWAVFDHDGAHLSVGNTTRFNAAFPLAIQENIEVAYSNEVFELWLLLHLKNVNPQPPMGRQQIYQEIEQNIRAYNGYGGFVYVHGARDVVDVINILGNETLAIQYARDLDLYHQQLGNAPINANPNTTVYQLIESLRAWILYYS